MLTTSSVAILANAQGDPLPPPAPTPAPAAQPQAPAAPATETTGAIDDPLTQVLAASAGGLRADELAARAEMSSPAVMARQKAVEAAAAKVDQAALLFIPRLEFAARYVRLSPVDEAKLGSGSLVGTTNPAGQPIPVVCPTPGTTDGCFIPAAGVNVSFPSLLNMWTLQGTLRVPLSDYLLRLTQNHAAASKSKRAAELQTEAERQKVRADARVAYYNWIRAKGGVVVAQQGLATVQAHLRDVKVAEQVGAASKADVLAVEGHEAATQLLVENASNMAELAEEQIRTMLHEPSTTQYKIGEDVTAALAPVKRQDAPSLLREAMATRLEVRVLDETLASLGSTRQTIGASHYPRLDAFGNLYHSNPNTRVFPQQEKWSTTWDVGVQLSWTFNDAFTTGAQVDELDAKVRELQAQRAQLADGIRLQTLQSYQAVKHAELARATTAQQLRSAQESHRVRRELFRAGKATSSELTDAETELLRARFDALNAMLDQRVAMVRLEHALGRERALSPVASSQP